MIDDIALHVRSKVAEARGLALEEVMLDRTFLDLGIDSLTAVSIAGDLEDDFGVSMPNADVLRLRTVRDVVEAVERLVRENAA